MNGNGEQGQQQQQGGVVLSLRSGKQVEVDPGAFYLNTTLTTVNVGGFFLDRCPLAWTMVDGKRVSAVELGKPMTAEDLLRIFEQGQILGRDRADSRRYVKDAQERLQEMMGKR